MADRVRSQAFSFPSAFSTCAGWGCVTLMLAAPASSAAPRGAKLPIGEFVVAKTVAPPVMDGTISDGEWDAALVTSGMMTPFDHTLQEAKTTVGFTFDEERFYFLFDCVRGDREWKLWKSVRENDGYSFGDPSIEIWLTPPALVPESYQNIINTYPAVLDMKTIPTRGYTAQGWRGNWQVGVTESDTRYIIEASLPASDLDGFDKAKLGDVWRFLLCRTSPGTKSRSQASWSITQGFAELAQHPTVQLVGDSPMLQVRNVSSLHSGTYDMGVTGIGARGRATKLDVRVRFHTSVEFSDNDRVQTHVINLPAGGSRAIKLTGGLADGEKGHLTIHAETTDGTTVFRQAWPYQVSGWTPKAPTRPENAREAQELDLMVRYGPVHNVVIARADIIDLPTRDVAAGGTVKIVDPASGKVLVDQPLPTFTEWYSNVHFNLDRVRVPVVDYGKVDYVRTQNKNIEAENKKREKRGQEPQPLRELPIPAPLPVRVEVTVADANGKELCTASRDLELRRHKFLWENNDIGVSDDVIPPWTPLTYKDGHVGVWNRSYDLNGLGLLDRAKNDDRDQIRRMRLVAVREGKEIEIVSGPPTLQRHVNAEARFAGTGTGAGLALRADTKVEFDGFVLSKLTIGPDDPAVIPTIDKLFWEVVLPESEATHFCSTSGGWSAVHAETPPYWSSQVTSSGVMIGDFVPYIWLTNSERAFLWFADSDRGWFTDDDRSHPTQEIRRENGTVTLRVHFVEVPTTFSRATTVEYGYQTFPSRPLPEGWRTVICSNNPRRLPDARSTYFWFDGDWAVLWPYYCSPYPWSWEKSKGLFERVPPQSHHRPMVGSIAHSIGRYRDYEGNAFSEYGVDWGETPGDLSNANVTQNRGSIDFRIHHYREWVRNAGFRGLYVDENYLSFDRNFLSGGAYIRPDGRLQIGYSYLGLREYFKRFRTMMHEEEAFAPNLWQHISSGSAYHAWFGDIFFEGENVEPTNLEFDYLAVLPAERMRAIGSSRCAGGVMSMMCQAKRHSTQWTDKHVHQFIGWVMAHDIVPEQVPEYELMAQEARFYRPTTFLPYWREDTPLKSDHEDVIVSAHRNDTRAIAWVVNTAREPRSVEISVDSKALGFDKKPLLINAETGKQVDATRRGFRVSVLERDFVAVYLLPTPEDAPSDASFVATFDNGSRADYALGADIWEPQGRRQSGSSLDTLPLTAGRDGKDKALLVGDGTAMRPHLNVTDTNGTVAADLLFTEAPRGSVFSATASDERDQVLPRAPTLHIEIEKKELVFGLKETVDKRSGWMGTSVVRIPHPGPGWRRVELTWTGGRVRLSIDGQAVGELPMARLNICSGTGRALLGSGSFVFGDRNHAVSAIDNVLCRR